jgi:hypothetical protein
MFLKFFLQMFEKIEKYNGLLNLNDEEIKPNKDTCIEKRILLTDFPRIPLPVHNNNDRKVTY